MSDWATNYPAFKWCSDYGTDWYLPAVNELSAIYNNISTINSTLSANGYTILYHDHNTEGYWSSTETSTSEANVSWFYNNGQIIKGRKESSYAVRAVLAF